MAKYIKLEDALKGLNMGYGKYDYVSKVADYYNNLPTIEVSEDCISRADTIKLLKDNKNYIDADPYPHDCACDLVEIAPSAVPTIEPQTYITEDRDTQILDVWQAHHRNTTTVEDEPTTEQSCDTCKHNKLKWFSEECDGCTNANSNWERIDE